MQEVGIVSLNSDLSKTKVMCGCLCDNEEQAKQVREEINSVIAKYIPEPTMNTVVVIEKDVVVMVKGECRDAVEKLREAINAVLSKF